jgi:glycosyltransferase involved in cell wall biosynthesis
MVKVSLLISTYNWPSALNLCLKSVLRQSILPDEILICDDGSTEETKVLIDSFIKESIVPIIHVWQPDEGFQLAKIRNKGFAAASGDYLIQIDGDLILNKDFIKDHIKFSREGSFSTGSRVLLSKETSDALIKQNSIDVKKLGKNNRNFLNNFRIPFLQLLLASIYKNKGKNKYYVKGCNMAFWKKDILKINGYNENFTGWGREDSEIAIRLINAGVTKRFLKFGGNCYHIFHKEALRDMEEKNIQMMNEAIENKSTYIHNGLSKYFNQ